MKDMKGVVPPWVQHFQLDCPVPDGPLHADSDPAPAVPGTTSAQRAPEVPDDLERVAVLSGN